MDYPYGYGNGSYGNGMSYQNGYSNTYANNPNMNQGYSQNQQRPVENTFAWVYGDAGAKAFPVAPGKTVLLMDSERPILYVKSTDMSGRPMPMETYELTRIDQQMYQSQRPMMISQAPQGDMSEYVKKSDLESEVTKIMNQNMGGMNGGNNGYGNPPEGNQR